MTLTMSPVECGEWLIKVVAATESALAEWLDTLAEFDLARGWAADGQLSCVDWLTWRCRMSRSTAYERLQVAHQLRRRPPLHDALHSGRISYSAARAIARISHPDPGVDETLIDLAEVGTVREVERMVAYHQRLADQGRPPHEKHPRRGVRTRPNYDGTTTLEITLTDLEAADVMAVLRAFIEEEDGGPASARADDIQADAEEVAEDTQRVPADAPESVDESARADDQTSWWTRAADAFMDMAHTAVKHARGGTATADERYLVHVVQHGDGMALLDGTSLDAAAAARLACDSSATAVLLGPAWEPLAMGRKVRQFNTSQRRALLIRDGGMCRFPGCTHRRWLQPHHYRWWTRRGATNVSNGLILCSAHHSLLHKGWKVTGEPNRELTFHRPDGTPVGSTMPRLRC